MNRLSGESSPYLKQHADNPVDWYPWGADAFNAARVADKPVLLSIGYAACHWCHVMAHESFENPATAALMNELFINIKVDREERPDLDSIYMQAVQAMTGSGGWPMTVFLTPAGVPFYGGTYFPPRDRHGMPAFARVLRGVADAYHTQRERVEETGASLREVLAAPRQPLPSGQVTPRGFEQAYRSLAASYDVRWAGFGSAPKFPPSMTLLFLVHHWARTREAQALAMALDTFLAMARGGIHDQVGGGLHRYAVDERWLVPHFEKMLYDNALFVRLGVALWQATGRAEVEEVVRDTVEWLRREMTSDEGGFYSSLDADSEGHEGRFYTWELPELRHAADGDAAVAESYWGATPTGNFEGRNILFVPNPASVVAARLGRDEADVTATIRRLRQRLYDVRRHRVPPARDEKVVTAWNGLMLRALTEAARVFADATFASLAVTNGRLLWDTLVIDGRALRTRLDGVSKGPGFLEDQAALGLAFLELYALTSDAVWIERAQRIVDTALELFFDRETGVFYDTARDHEALIARPRDLTDNATPSGQSLIAELLLRMGEYSGTSELGELGSGIVASLFDGGLQHPGAFGQLLSVADLVAYGSIQVVVAGEHSERLRAAIRSTFVPSLVLDVDPRAQGSGPSALRQGKTALNGEPTAYVCQRYVCDAPTHHPDELTKQLERAILPGA